MGNGFAAFIQQMELLAFYSGFPLVYTFVRFLSGEHRKQKNIFTIILPRFLPYSYALTGTLYFGLVLKNISPDFTWETLKATFLSGWNLYALMSLLFWIRFFNRKKFLALIHSLLFFCWLMKDIVQQFFYGDTKDMINNDLRIYTASILINSASLLFIVILFYSYKAVNTRTAHKI